VPVAPVAAPASSAAVAEVVPDFARPDRSWAPRPEPRLDQTVRVVLRPTPTPTAPPTPPPTPRPAVAAAQAAAAPAQPPARTPEPTPAPVAAGGSSRVSGEASWYCQTGVSACHHAYPGGMYAAAGPALRVGDWRGRTVSVCGGGGCVAVTLVDWCQCYGTRVIDLYSDAFRQLAPLNSGTIQVTVSW
jgi:rare lipoprotein A (peptidoglycan hydrolase)